MDKGEDGCGVLCGTRRVADCKHSSLRAGSRFACLFFRVCVFVRVCVAAGFRACALAKLMRRALLCMTCVACCVGRGGLQAVSILRFALAPVLLSCSYSSVSADGLAWLVPCGRGLFQS